MKRKRNLGVDPSVGDGERAVVLDDVVERSGDGTSFWNGYLWVDLSHIHCPTPRHVPNQQTPNATMPSLNAVLHHPC